MYMYRFYVLSIEKIRKKYCFVPAKDTFIARFPSQDLLSTEFCINVHAPNRGFFAS